MKAITYKATYQTQSATTEEEFIEVQARDLNSGARKALGRALHGLPEGWEFCGLEFWLVGTRADAVAISSFVAAQARDAALAAERAAPGYDPAAAERAAIAREEAPPLGPDRREEFRNPYPDMTVEEIHDVGIPAPLRPATSEEMEAALAEPQHTHRFDAMDRCHWCHMHADDIAERELDARLSAHESYLDSRVGGTY